MNNITQFTLLRHGLPEQAGCLLGRTDPPLNAKGWQQMQLSSGQLEFDVIISSPLQRCLAFARHLAMQQDCRLIVSKEWQELDFGLWDGQPIANLWDDPQQTYSRYWHAPFEHTPPQGESTHDLMTRITGSVDSLGREFAGKRILIISHSGVMRMALAWLLGSSHQGNPHLSRIQLDHAALLHFNTYLDDNKIIWPQLQGFTNPCLALNNQTEKC